MYKYAVRADQSDWTATGTAECQRRAGGVTVGGSRRIVQRLEPFDQRPHVLTQLYLGEQDADRAVRVGEEVGPQSAGPADAAALGSLCLYRHTKTPSHPVPEPREEAVRGLARRRHLVASHLPQVIG